MKRHDRVSSTGGYLIDPNVLAHDLTMLKLSKDTDITSSTAEEIIYDRYIKYLEHFEILVESRQRYDDSFIN